MRAPQRHPSGDADDRHDTPPHQRTLADLSDETILVQCDQCPGISRHDRSALIDRFGENAPLDDVFRNLCRPREPGEPEHEPRLLTS